MSKMRSEHAPIGNPCIICHLPRKQHRVDHEFKGGNKRKCAECTLPLEQHRLRSKTDERPRGERPRKLYKTAPLYLGIDGEGQGRVRHRYVMVAASSEDGSHEYHISDPRGLSTERILGFIWGMPQRARLFAYSFGYDLTKILEDLDNETLWSLFRPETRQRLGKEAIKGPKPVQWNGWILNLQGTKFTISRKGSKRKRIIWDIWKFYQGKFTKALEQWKIGTPEERQLIANMKDKRSEFDKESEAKVLEYCLMECRKMAEQARRLIEAHDRAGLPLKNFYGAGSTASVMLEQMGVRAHIKKPPEEMRTCVAQAFFGGRFDNSVVGLFDQTVHGYDISSAYPYECCQVPCLAHGRWEYTDKREALDGCRHALVHYGMHPVSREYLELPWGPFPYRSRDGSITYPTSSGGGWVWQTEFLEGERLFPQVHFKGAWLWRPECECMPFIKIPQHYIERCRIGKEGPGIVLKLGCNSCYGKVAQSIGNGRYNSWVWAGMITSGCRAKILQALGLHNDWSNMLMVATDGILTLEKLEFAAPIETGTFHVFECKKHKKMCNECPESERTYKPLGGWEYKKSDGVFIARPGVYFPLNPTREQETDIRGRGVGRNVVLENYKDIVRTWERWSGVGDWPELKLRNVSRFCGAKTSISRSRHKKTGEWVYNRANGEHLPNVGEKAEPRYGEWINREVKLSFNPFPKRGGIGDDKRSLLVRYPGDRTALEHQLDMSVESMPYKKSMESEEAKQLRLLAQEISEQPHGDFADYELSV